MACVGTPTLTQFTTVTSTGTTTTFLDNISTPPDLVSTIVTQSCLASIGIGLNATCVDVTVATTIPGVPSTVETPVTLTSLFTQIIPVETLFASCGDTLISQSSISSSRTSITTTTSSSSSPAPTSQSEPTVSTTSAANNPAVITQFITSTQPGSAVYMPTSEPQSSVQHDGNDNSRINAVPIIGGAFGGFVGLICIVAFLWFLIQRRHRRDNMFEKDDEVLSVRSGKDRQGRFDLDADVEPRPYQYGLVGYTSSPPAGGSPPGSPLLSTNVNNISAISHRRQRSSITPLMLTPSMSTPRLSIRTATSSRPSTGGSTKPLQRPAQRGPAVTEFVVTRPTAHHSQHSNGSSKLSQPVSISSWRPAADYRPSDGGDGSSRAGSPTSIHEPQFQLQIVNAPPSPDQLVGSPEQVGSLGAVTKPNGGKRQSSLGVIVHTDGGRVDADRIGTAAANQPPAYDA